MNKTSCRTAQSVNEGGKAHRAIGDGSAISEGRAAIVSRFGNTSPQRSRQLSELSGSRYIGRRARRSASGFVPGPKECDTSFVPLFQQHLQL